MISRQQAFSGDSQVETMNAMFRAPVVESTRGGVRGGGAVVTETVPRGALDPSRARELGHQVRVGRFPLPNLGKAMILGAREGFVKIVADERYGEILGIHIVGPHATELVAEAVVPR